MKCIADTNPNSHKDTGEIKNPAFPEHFPEPTEDELKIAEKLFADLKNSRVEKADKTR